MSKVEFYLKDIKIYLIAIACLIANFIEGQCLRLPDYMYLQANPWQYTLDSHSRCISELGVGWQLNKKDPSNSFFFALTELNILRFSGKKWVNTKQKKSCFAFGSALIFRWIVPASAKYIKKYPMRPWIQVGSGPNFFLSRYICFKPRPLSIRLQFATHVGIGTRFGKNDKAEVGLFYKHFSNANIRYPNFSIDTIEARIAYWF